MSLKFSDEVINSLLDLAKDAGNTILDYYQTDMQVRKKADQSLVTEADEKAEEIILHGLTKLTPYIPVIGEEAYSAGKRHDISKGVFWLVDALDGTKEFVNQRDEFTVNIALIEAGIAIFGIIHAPALAKTFWGGAFGAYSKNRKNQIKKIVTRTAPKDGITVVSSRSNRGGESNFLTKYNVKTTVKLGSSLKICLIAAGEADLYIRMGPTSEWDIAAGHAILTAAGGSITQIDGSPLQYGKDTILNPSFVAHGLPN